MLHASRIKGANELRSVIVSGLTCCVFTAGPGICFTPHHTKLYPLSTSRRAVAFLEKNTAHQVSAV